MNENLFSTTELDEIEIRNVKIEFLLRTATTNASKADKNYKPQIRYKQIKNLKQQLKNSLSPIKKEIDFENDLEHEDN